MKVEKINKYNDMGKNERNNKKFKESPRVIDRVTSAHFCVSDQYLTSKVLRTK